MKNFHYYGAMVIKKPSAGHMENAGHVFEKYSRNVFLEGFFPQVYAAGSGYSAEKINDRGV